MRVLWSSDSSACCAPRRRRRALKRVPHWPRPFPRECRQSGEALAASRKWTRGSDKDRGVRWTTRPPRLRLFSPGTSADGVCSKRKVGDDDDDHPQRESGHAHQAGVRDGSRSPRLEACDGSKGGNDDREAEPCEPSHGWHVNGSRVVEQSPSAHTVLRVELDGFSEDAPIPKNPFGSQNVRAARSAQMAPSRYRTGTAKSRLRRPRARESNNSPSHYSRHKPTDVGPETRQLKPRNQATESAIQIS